MTPLDAAAHLMAIGETSQSRKALVRMLYFLFLLVEWVTLVLLCIEAICQYCQLMFVIANAKTGIRVISVCLVT